MSGSMEVRELIERMGKLENRVNSYIKRIDCFEEFLKGFEGGTALVRNEKMEAGEEMEHPKLKFPPPPRTRENRARDGEKN